MSEFFTEKQKDFIRDLKHDKLKRINILEGSVRSGKTWVSLVAWALWIAKMPKNKKYLMIGKTLTTLKRNCLEPLAELVGKENFWFSISSKRAVLFGHSIDLEGANDAQSENKIRGLTLQGAYADEITLFPEDFFTMLLSRLSEKGAKFFGSTNPDSPSHWLKKKYLDREEELSLYRMSFVIDDNTFLDPDYITSIKSEYTGVFFKRFILGLWVIAEGLVYQFDVDKHCTDEIPEHGEYYLSIDYGTMNPFSCGLWCVNGDRAVRIKEYYYSGRETSIQKTDEEYADEVDKLTEGYSISRVVVDPSAASFIAVLKKRGYSVLKAKNDVIDGIRVTSRMLEKGNIKIHSSCKDAINEFGLYSWNDKASTDEVIKENDHCVTGDTLVETENGSIPIKELVGKTGLVWSYSRFFRKKVLRKFFDVRLTQKNARIYKITLDDGREIRCTGNHRILTETGWKRTDALTVSDKIIDVGETNG